MNNFDEASPYKTCAYSLMLKAFIVANYFLLIALFLYLPRFVGAFSEKYINIYVFTEMVSPDAVREFEKLEGIKIYIRYFETNEELLAKFRVSEGEGYDLITPSDYMVELLCKEGMLHEIDHSKIKSFQELDEKLLNHFYDPGNKYSLPLAWFTYGLIYEKSIFSHWREPAGLDLIFDMPKVSQEIGRPYKICMLDDPREVIMFAAIYLFGKSDNLTPQEFAAVQDLLIKQKRWVEAYTSSSLQYFLISNIVPLAITPSFNMIKISRVTDRFDFKLPQQGSLMVIENIAIPNKCKKIEQVYKFIDFILSKKIEHINSSIYGYNPTNKQSYSLIDKKILENASLFPSDEAFAKLRMVHNNFFVKNVENIWLGVKFA